MRLIFKISLSSDLTKFSGNLKSKILFNRDYSHLDDPISNNSVTIQYRFYEARTIEYLRNLKVDLI